MKKLFPAVAILSLGLSIPLAKAQSQPAQNSAQPLSNRASNRVSPTTQIVSGEAFFLERLALAPGAMLHVSLVGRVAGAEYLPLATTIVPARNGVTPFELEVPPRGIPAGPYRLQAWIIGDGRAMFVGRDAQTTLDALGTFARIRLKIVPAPQNIDGIGDGRLLPALPQTAAPSPATPLPATPLPVPPIPMTPIPAAPRARPLRGEVFKLDRRAISPDARLEINLRDISLADAPSTLILGQAIQLDGRQLPRSFQMPLLPDDLKPGRRYALSARVYEAGKLTYSTDTVFPVTPENRDQPFKLRLVAAR